MRSNFQLRAVFVLCLVDQRHLGLGFVAVGVLRVRVVDVLLCRGSEAELPLASAEKTGANHQDQADRQQTGSCDGRRHRHRGCNEGDI